MPARDVARYVSTTTFSRSIAQFAGLLRMYSRTAASLAEAVIVEATSPNRLGKTAFAGFECDAGSVLTKHRR